MTNYLEILNIGEQLADLLTKACIHNKETLNPNILSDEKNYNNTNIGRKKNPHIRGRVLQKVYIRKVGLWHFV